MNRTWLKLQSRIHQSVYRLSDGKIGSYFGAPTLLLTTIGRKSGKPRTNPLYYVEHASGWAVIASNAGSDTHPAWFLNLQVNPFAEIQIRGQRFKVKSQIATSPGRDQLWSEFLEIYAGYAKYQDATHREMPVVILKPQST